MVFDVLKYKEQERICYKELETIVLKPDRRQIKEVNGSTIITRLGGKL